MLCHLTLSDYVASKMHVKALTCQTHTNPDYSNCHFQSATGLAELIDPLIFTLYLLWTNNMF